MTLQTTPLKTTDWMSRKSKVIVSSVSRGGSREEAIFQLESNTFHKKKSKTFKMLPCKNFCYPCRFASGESYQKGQGDIKSTPKKNGNQRRI